MSSSAATVSRLRAAGQLLHRPAGLDAATVVRRLGAVQAQDVRAYPLALRARTTAPVRLADAGVARTWLMRGTLHLVAEEDAGWMRALLAPAVERGSWRRLRALGFDGRSADRAVDVLAAAVDRGPLPRERVAALLEAERLPAEGQAPVHALRLAALRGLLVLDPADGTLRRPAPAGAAPADPVVELARRHLASRAPARPEDLAAWAGRPLGEARRAWRELDLVELAGGWALRGHVPEPVAAGLVRLLPGFDELLLGWRERAPVLPVRHAAAVLPGGGVIRAVVTRGGRVAGTWTRDGVELFARVSRAAIAVELDEIRRARSPGDPAASS